MSIPTDNAMTGSEQDLTICAYRLLISTVRERPGKQGGFREGRRVDSWSFSRRGIQGVFFYRHVPSHVNVDGMQPSIRNTHSTHSDAGRLIIASTEISTGAADFFAPESVDGIVRCCKTPGSGLKHYVLPDRDNLQERMA